MVDPVSRGKNNRKRLVVYRLPALPGVVPSEQVGPRSGEEENGVWRGGCGLVLKSVE